MFKFCEGLEAFSLGNLHHSIRTCGLSTHPQNGIAFFQELNERMEDSFKCLVSQAGGACQVYQWKGDPLTQYGNMTEVKNISRMFAAIFSGSSPVPER